MYTRQRSENPNAVRMLKEKSKSQFEYEEYSVPVLRRKFMYSRLFALQDYECLFKSSGTIRNWKRHRKTQYKPL